MTSKKMATYAMLVAITIILAITPIGMIPLPTGVSITIMHIPVIIAAILYGAKGGLALGLAFGLAGWYVALTRAVSPIDLLFTNPLFAVVPRALFGLFTGWLATCVFSSKWKLSIKAGIVGFVGSLIHSILVLGFLFLFALIDFAGMTILEAMAQYFYVLVGAISINVIIEAAVAMLVSIALAHALLQINVLNKQKENIKSSDN